MKKIILLASVLLTGCGVQQNKEVKENDNIAYTITTDGDVCEVVEGVVIKREVGVNHKIVTVEDKTYQTVSPHAIDPRYEAPEINEVVKVTVCRVMNDNGDVIGSYHGDLVKE